MLGNGVPFSLPSWPTALLPSSHNYEIRNCIIRAAHCTHHPTNPTDRQIHRLFGLPLLDSLSANEIVRMERPTYGLWMNETVDYFIIIFIIHSKLYIWTVNNTDLESSKSPLKKFKVLEIFTKFICHFTQHTNLQGLHTKYSTSMIRLKSLFTPW